MKYFCKHPFSALALCGLLLAAACESDKLQNLRVGPDLIGKENAALVMRRRYLQKKLGLSVRLPNDAWIVDDRAEDSLARFVRRDRGTGPVLFVMRLRVRPIAAKGGGPAREVFGKEFETFLREDLAGEIDAQYSFETERRELLNGLEAWIAVRRCTLRGRAARLVLWRLYLVERGYIISFEADVPDKIWSEMKVELYHFGDHMMLLGKRPDGR